MIEKTWQTESSVSILSSNAEHIIEYAIINKPVRHMKFMRQEMGNNQSTRSGRIIESVCQWGMAAIVWPTCNKANDLL